MQGKKQQALKVILTELVRALIDGNETLFSLSDLDCGNISLTLGTYSLPLRKELPHTNQRIYYMQGKKQQALKVILTMMLRHGLIRRVRTASFSSPVFLIDKKDSAALPRLLADVRQLNSHLTLPVQNDPSPVAVDSRLRCVVSFELSSSKLF